jgi:gamma-glutamylcyclotransferase (GGCT)/AIG2-like uncharacterized protein YtfP
MKTLRVLCAENVEWIHRPAVWAIEKVEEVNFNHVAFQDEDCFIYEAVWPKCRKISSREWLKKFKLIRTYEIIVSENQYKLIMTKINKQVGRSYSIWQCAMIYVAQSVSLLKEKIESTNWNGWKALICSEFVARPIVEVLDYRFDQGLDSVGMDEVEIMLKALSARSY